MTGTAESAGMAALMRERRLRNGRLRHEKGQLVDFIVTELHRRPGLPSTLDLGTNIQDLSVQRLIDNVLSGGTFTATVRSERHCLSLRVRCRSAKD